MEGARVGLTASPNQLKRKRTHVVAEDEVFLHPEIHGHHVVSSDIVDPVHLDIACQAIEIGRGMNERQRIAFTT